MTMRPLGSIILAVMSAVAWGQGSKPVSPAVPEAPAGASLTSTATGCPAPSMLMLVGSITRVDREKMTITVRDRQGEEHLINIDKSTLIRRGRELVTIAEVAPRCRTMVRYHVDKGGKYARYLSVPPVRRMPPRPAKEEEDK